MNNLLLVWNKETEIGIPIIDEQHHGLSSIVNSLFYCMGSGRGGKVLHNTITVFEIYAKLHFEVEETIMRQIGFIGLEKHTEAHQKLDAHLISLLVKSRKCEDPGMLIEFFKDNWLEHIHRWDRRYVAATLEYLEKRSV